MNLKKAMSLPPPALREEVARVLGYRKVRGGWKALPGTPPGLQPYMGILPCWHREPMVAHAAADALAERDPFFRGRFAETLFEAQTGMRYTPQAFKLHWPAMANASACRYCAAMVAARDKARLRPPPAGARRKG